MLTTEQQQNITLDERIIPYIKPYYNIEYVNEVIAKTWPIVKPDYEEEITASLKLIAKIMYILTSNTESWQCGLNSTWSNMLRLRTSLSTGEQEILFRRNGLIFTPFGDFTTGSNNQHITESIIREHFPNIEERDVVMENYTQRMFVLRINPVRYLVPHEFVSDNFDRIKSLYH